MTVVICLASETSHQPRRQGGHLTSYIGYLKSKETSSPGPFFPKDGTGSAGEGETAATENTCHCFIIPEIQHFQEAQI
jgi:hypothetical protein